MNMGYNGNYNADGETKKPLILVMDDDKGIRSLLHAALTRFYDVICVDSAEDGLEQLKQVDPDLILTDYEMPGMNGIEAARYVRMEDTRVPIIMISGAACPDLCKKALCEGLDEFLCKPIDLGNLLMVIKRHLAAQFV